MTGAEYDTRRRSLGLSIEETAWLHNVNVRQVRRWIREDTPVPASVEARLDELEEMMGRSVDFAVQQATDRVDAGPIILFRYISQDVYEASPDKAGLPLGAHAMMISWAAEELRAEGVAVEIRWRS